MTVANEKPMQEEGGARAGRQGGSCQVRSVLLARQGTTRTLNETSRRLSVGNVQGP